MAAGYSGLPGPPAKGVSAISTIITILLVVFLLFLIVGGVGLYFAVKLGKAATKKARAASTRLAAHVGAMGTGEAADAERLRVDLRREVSLTRQALDHAARQGWSLGDLPVLVREVGEHAEVLDTQLGLYAQQRRSTGYIDHVTLDRLREQHVKLSTTCARIRADLMDNQVNHASSAINDVHDRAELELEARRSTSVRDPLDEIDELYRRSLQHPARPPEDGRP
ncbi:hypothetical protein [Spongiactinospora sp. TRM90649]|uniref:hypothetical protein n=1 Tax=Spongiactinospora sp. TRM90649 TaxID=3031114 RepID=UPI0023F71B0C|nr:hypothetical protein [Spongiactinospora sp. TRM90649]MDF5755936.1 hypothetical protein [Spongiactinospora sp. TRM90649]